MDIELIDVSQNEFEQVFIVVKEGIFPYVEAPLAGMTNFNASD